MNLDSNDVPVISVVRNVVNKLQMIEKCHVCEAVLAEDGQFCDKCVTPIATKCNTCGKDIIQGRKYCRYCGAEL